MPLCFQLKRHCFGELKTETQNVTLTQWPPETDCAPFRLVSVSSLKRRSRAQSRVFNLYYIMYTVGVDSPSQPSESQYSSPCWPLWGWLTAECWPILLWQCPTWLPHTWPACLGRRDWWERRSPGEKEQSGSIRMCCSHLIRTVSGIFFWTPWGQKNSEHSSSIYGVTWG